MGRGLLSCALGLEGTHPSLTSFRIAGLHAGTLPGGGQKARLLLLLDSIPGSDPELSLPRSKSSPHVLFCRSLQGTTPATPKMTPPKPHGHQILKDFVYHGACLHYTGDTVICVYYLIVSFAPANRAQ